jgi:hypothetical protein
MVDIMERAPLRALHITVGFATEPRALRPFQGRRFELHDCPVVSSLALLNHRLMAAIPSGCVSKF